MTEEIERYGGSKGEQFNAALSLQESPWCVAIAVDKKGNVYITQSGNPNMRIYIADANMARNISEFFKMAAEEWEEISQFRKPKE